MQIHHFIVSAAIAAFVTLVPTACSDDPSRDDGKNGGDPVVEFSFTESPFTRAVIEEDGSGSFSEGDRIDLYAQSASGTVHHVLTMRNGEWTPALRRSQLGTGEAALTAYYPAAESAPEAGEDYRHAVRADQSGEEAFAVSDLLRSSAKLAAEQTSVEMNFTHAMHRLRVNVRPEEGGSLPEDLKVEVLSIPSGSIAEDGSAAVDASAQAVWIAAHAMTEGWAAILFPQPTEPYASKGWIRLSANGKSNTFDLPSEIEGRPFDRLEAGREVTVNLSLNEQGGEEDGYHTLYFDSNGGKGEIPPRRLKTGEITIMPDGAEFFTKANSKFYAWNSSPSKEGIVDWVVGQPFTMPDHDMTAYAVWHIVDDNVGGACEEFKGMTKWLKGIRAPQKSDWKQVITWDETEGLDGKTVPTRPGCGWYDVSQGIYNMCWAAGASDMLHYWMDRNQQYLDRYGYKGPRKYYYEYAGSDIFDVFLDHWDLDNGGYAQQGFYWFLVGSDMNEGGGYFKDVFENKVVADYMVPTGGREAVSRKALTEFITRAFKEDMAIGLDMPSVGKIHQYVVWGADYDEEGYIKGVYYVNPNDFRGHAGTVDGEHLGLLHMEIVYLEDGGAYTESSVPGSYMPIQRIEVCAIGQDVWEEYFRNHPEK